MGAPSLRELFYNHSGNLIHKWDHYLDLYEQYFGENVSIYAMDINPQCKQFEDDKIKIFIGSPEDEKFL